LPRAETVPIAGEIDTSVASLTVQFRVAELPRSMALGSAENCIAGLAAGGGATTAGGGGGGGGGGGTFFLQPAAMRNMENANSNRLIFRLVI
jgi:hypothetical protein